MSKRRVCIIGNSHVAALRSGLDLLPELDQGFTFDFFAAQRDLMRDMELKGETLVSTSELTKGRMRSVSGGKTCIDTAEYTDFIIVGLGFNYLQATAVLKKNQVFGYHGSSKRFPMISRPCLVALIAEYLNLSKAMFFARLLRSVSKARIIIIPQPYPSKDIKTNGKGDFWKSVAYSGLLTLITTMYEDVAKRIVDKAGCEILFQPVATLSQPGMTLAIYSVDSIRLGSTKNHTYPPGQASHMNSAFGAETLRATQELLQQH